MRDGMGSAIDRVVSAQVDHVIMGVALEAFWGGVKQAAELQDNLEQRAGVGVSMGSTATVTALRALEVGKDRGADAAYAARRRAGARVFPAVWL